MTPFTEVAKNWGDFKAPWVRNGGAFDGNESRSIEGLLRDNGSNAYRDTEPGYGRVANISGAIFERRGRRYYEHRMSEAASLIYRGFRGSKRDLLNLQEAMSISDFPNLFGDVIDRAVLANYLETPYTWNLVAHQAEVSDFRPVRRFRVDGGTGLLAAIQTSSDPNPGQLLPIEQGGQYPEDYLTDAQYTYRLAKYGKRMPFFWETFVNDDLNALKDTPARFGRGARRTEEFFVTQLYAGNLTFFSNANKNRVNAANAGGAFTKNDPALNITALQQAIVVLMNQVDTTGQPISVEAMTLVVPPALKTVAMNILNTDYVWMGDQGGTNGGANTFPLQQMHAMNWAKNIVRLAVNYYLPIVDTVQGTTGWYLFSNPENGRPALEFGKLRGHNTPELFMKLPNSVAIGEGTMGPGPGVIPGTSNMSPLEGDFDTDSVHYKIRDVFGGTQIDPIMAVFSAGTTP